ncbi:hypothetical protein [Thermophilibacter provencensis]|uniref:Uncharacterized protein n=1 Tax=Thermophilibacter provencensis TaxID=1852386 RepID=A0ABT7V265_9ACTN|nr:hypothetical protein [Thermophilibacter provencensis]MDM8270566.1 hypothetical protein [Thermophilibacter provencensis]
MNAEYVCLAVPLIEVDTGLIHTEYVSRERVVRCWDCKHAEPCPLADSEKLICAFHDEMLVNPDDFCAWGEPRVKRDKE